MPRFSVIMPTRNRAALLQFALQSASEQIYEDYEIVVSDNRSDDNTKQLVESFNSNRIRYAQTPDALSMPDSWEFAVSQDQ